MTTRLSVQQRATLQEALAKGRIETRGRNSPHHQRLADRGLLRRAGATRISVPEYRSPRYGAPAEWVTRRYRGVVWVITAEGRELLEEAS